MAEVTQADIDAAARSFSFPGEDGDRVRAHVAALLARHRTEAVKPLVEALEKASRLIKLQADCLEGYAESSGHPAKPIPSVFHLQATHFRDLAKELHTLSTTDTTSEVREPEAIGGGEAEKVENRPRLLAMDHLNGIEEPIRGLDERGHPYLSYSGAHVIAAFVAGMQKQAALATPQPVSGDAVREALAEFIYETTHLSPMKPDGSHWCNISAETLRKGREALKGEARR